MYHPGARRYLDEYKYYLMHPSDVVYVEGQSRHHFFSGQQYSAVDPVDPIAPDVRALVKKFNLEEFVPYLQMMCDHYGQVQAEKVILYHVDRMGFTVLAKTAQTEHSADGEAGGNWVNLRFPFPYVLESAELCENAMMEAFDHTANLYDKQHLANRRSRFG